MNDSGYLQLTALHFFRMHLNPHRRQSCEELGNSINECRMVYSNYNS